MVAAAHRISRGSDFNRTLKSGVRVSTRDLVVHVYPLPVPLASLPDSSAGEAGRLRDSDLVTTGGPRLGLIVSKSVGNAVTRHRVARRLRAAFMSAAAELSSSETMVVVRARPSAATSTTLPAQMSDAFAHRRVREACTRTQQRQVRP